MENWRDVLGLGDDVTFDQVYDRYRQILEAMSISVTTKDIVRLDEALETARKELEEAPSCRSEGPRT